MKRALQERLAKSIRGTAKKLLPAAVIEEVRKFRAYDKNERPVYAKLRLSNGLGLFAPKLRRPPKSARKFLFVCFGNIIRSPMCEVLMNRELDRLGRREFTVTSAGLNATPGRLAHPWAVTAARELGISLKQHRARPLTPELVEQADVIFAMDYQNQVQLLSRWASARHKVFMLAAYAGEEYRSVEIGDPYYQDQEQTRSCYNILSTCIQNLVRSISN
jgi:protein-tyrosine phosphatase